MITASIVCGLIAWKDPALANGCRLVFYQYAADVAEKKRHDERVGYFAEVNRTGRVPDWIPNAPPSGILSWSGEAIAYMEQKKRAGWRPPREELQRTQSTYKEPDEESRAIVRVLDLETTQRELIRHFYDELDENRSVPSWTPTPLLTISEYGWNWMARDYLKQKADNEANLYGDAQFLRDIPSPLREKVRDRLANPQGIPGSRPMGLLWRKGLDTGGQLYRLGNYIQLDRTCFCRSPSYVIKELKRELDYDPIRKIKYIESLNAIEVRYTHFRYKQNGQPAPDTFKTVLIPECPKDWRIK